MSETDSFHIPRIVPVPPPEHWRNDLAGGYETRLRCLTDIWLVVNNELGGGEQETNEERTIRIFNELDEVAQRT